MLEPAQIRAARALLGWRQDDLSKAAGVGTATIQRIEKSDRAISGYVSTLVRIEAAFESAGVLIYRRRRGRRHRHPFSQEEAKAMISVM